jgi:hypothetical protein
MPLTPLAADVGGRLDIGSLLVSNLAAVAQSNLKRNAGVLHNFSNGLFLLLGLWLVHVAASSTPDAWCVHVLCLDHRALLRWRLSGIIMLLAALHESEEITDLAGLANSSAASVRREGDGDGHVFPGRLLPHNWSVS